jgi:Fe-S-cluster-containing hydrogenase component 2
VNSQRPLISLRQGQWFKLICGASYQHLPMVRNLALVYTLAGADCIDVAADRAVVMAALEGIEAAMGLAPEVSTRPWLMVSLNDGEDPHFRKAVFDSTVCPADCPRPCETICPAEAITVEGVISERCYGCGRCLPVCPLGLIEAQAFETKLDAIATSLLPSLIPYISAIEIHTKPNRADLFARLWQQLQPFVAQLQLIAVSCPDGEGVIEYLRSLHEQMQPSPTALIWQTDGRPMSGDIGDGTTHAAIAFGQKVLNARLPGYVQLAGGTNAYTVEKLKHLNLWDNVSGVAYGSYARRLVMPLLETTPYLETEPEQLCLAVALASELVSQVKGESPIKFSMNKLCLT